MTPRMMATLIESILGLIVLYWYVKGIKPGCWLIYWGYCSDDETNEKVNSLSIKQKLAGFFTIVASVLMFSIFFAYIGISFVAWLHTLNSGSWY